MTDYGTPGVYIVEESTGSRPITALGTSTPGFVGVAPDPTRHVHQPIAINNWSQFLKEYVGNRTNLTDLASAVHGFFSNGGSRCYVVNVGEGGSIVGKPREGVAALEQVDEVAIVAAPGATSFADYSAVLNHCSKLKDRVAILDAPNVTDPKEIDRLKTVGTEGPPKDTKDKDEKEGGGKRTPVGGGGGLRPAQQDGGYGAFYFPWIRIRNPLNPKQTVEVPPSGHIAGVWARTDAVRGVHKAPANTAVEGAVGVTYRVTDQEQDTLNPAGVNCIRFFPREGIRVWGARTIAPASSEWRYLSVRRLFAMVEESIALGTRWVVFEPNDEDLWNAIERDVTAFLLRLWRDGAIKGSTPEEAFFVQCDEETNPHEEIVAGKVTIKIGIAPVRPAEFVVFRIGQYEGGTEVEAE